MPPRYYYAYVDMRYARGARMRAKSVCFATLRRYAARGSDVVAGARRPHTRY